MYRRIYISSPLSISCLTSCCASCVTGDRPVRLRDFRFQCLPRSPSSSETCCKAKLRGTATPSRVSSLTLPVSADYCSIYCDVWCVSRDARQCRLSVLSGKTLFVAEAFHLSDLSLDVFSSGNKSSAVSTETKVARQRDTH